MPSEDKDNLSIGDGDLRTAFTLLVRTVERFEHRLEKLEDKVDTTIEGIAEVKREQVAQGIIGEQTLKQTTQTNGRVTALENWQDKFDDETQYSGAYDAGRRSIRDGERALLRKVWSKGEKYVIWSIGGILVGVGIRLGSWYIEGSLHPWW